MRGSRRRAAVALITAGIVLSGLSACASQLPIRLNAAPPGGCADVNAVTAVAVHRVLVIRNPGWRRLSVVERKPVLARRVFRDFCRTVAHPVHLRGPVSCPLDLGESYVGAFLAADAVVARFDWHPAGCATLFLRVGGRGVTTEVTGRAAVAAPDMAVDFARLLHIPTEAIFFPQ